MSENSSQDLFPGVLVLADGKKFEGLCFGAKRGQENPVLGEVVFNTSMYGYQEILTDPSYAGQILTFTYPHIGNVGCNPEDWESNKFHAAGLVIRDLSIVSSNYRAKQSLAEFCKAAGVMGICGLDTRELVAHIRDRGAQMGVICSGDKLNTAELVELAKAQGSMAGKDYVKAVSCQTPYTWEEGTWLESGGYSKVPAPELNRRPHVVAIDCGLKHNILRLLVQSGFRVTVVPATYSAAQIEQLKPQAIFYSNGPGDPATLDYVVSSCKGLLGRYPLFGICLGHQILAQALGAKTFKLKFGHRGANHPVMECATGKIEITVQNHGFAVEAGQLGSEARISHINLNDNTVEGIEVPSKRAFSVQYHPEASPGPHDALHYFKRFYEMTVN